MHVENIAKPHETNKIEEDVAESKGPKKVGPSTMLEDDDQEF